jgi:hypothetical protein
MPSIKDHTTVNAIVPSFNITADMLARQEEQWEKAWKQAMTDIFRMMADGK